MIVRKFVCADGELGIGWLPMWVKDKDIDPSEGLTIAHDILEHMVDNKGGAEGEFMALGAMLWTRGESGWFYSRKQPYYRSIPQMFSGDVAMILEKIANGHQSLCCPGRTRSLGEDYDHWENDIEEAVTLGINEFHLNFGEHTELPFDEDTILDRIMGWMRKGFHKAVNYYSKHGLHYEEVAYLFDKIVEETNRYKPHNHFDGQIMTVRINYKTQDVSVSVDDWY